MAIDTKYGRVEIPEGEHAPFADDEPIFIIRAKDVNALAAIDAYAKLCETTGSPPHHLSEVMNARARFREWRIANPESMSQPD